MLSSPPSSGSSRSGSPDTRATSPGSPSSPCQEDPVLTHLWMGSTELTPTVLRTLFARHVDLDRSNISVVISDDPSAAPETSSSWDRAVLAIDGEVYEYIVIEGKGYSQLEDCLRTTQTPYIRTTPSAAAHLRLFARAGLRAVSAVPFSTAGTVAYVLERPSIVFSPLADVLADSLLPAPVYKSTSTDLSESSKIPMQGNIPTLAEWDALWVTWDAVTIQMIPPAMLHTKPIDLRHKCLFYIGHIPTFLDMLLSKAIGGAPTEPAWFWTIFERGIDPHVDDPDHCHNHSVVPTADEDWPTLDAVLGFRDGVRARLRALYAELAAGTRPLSRNIARTLVMTHEHEAFHVETLLYMLIQRADGLDVEGTLPPPSVTPPPWALLTEQWAKAPRPARTTVRVSAGAVVLGHDDSEADDFVTKETNDAPTKTDVPATPGHMYGWDNESPARCVPVHAFTAEWRCVTNAEYHAFWAARGRCADAFVRPIAGAAASSPCTPVPLPPSWVLQPDGAVHVRTFFGPVPFAIAAEWPVLASHDGLAAYAAARGGRLPSEAELRRFLDLYDVGYDGGANVGMRNWHPVPATMGLPENGGRGCNGGVWEWTASEFATHDGLVPTALFTGYSEDFFDGKHIISLGGSYATLPRLGRRTVRNFYQHNYPYPWIGARVVYDD